MGLLNAMRRTISVAEYETCRAALKAWHREEG